MECFALQIQYQVSFKLKMKGTSIIYQSFWCCFHRSSNEVISIYPEMVHPFLGHLRHVFFSNQQFSYLNNNFSIFDTYIIRNYLIVPITPLHLVFSFVLHKYKQCNNKMGFYFLSCFKKPLYLWADWSMLRVKCCIFLKESCIITQKQVPIFFLSSM